MLSYLVFYSCQYAPVPLFPIFYVDQLSLSDGMIGIATALFHSMVMLMSLGLNRVVALKGHRFTLITGAVAFGLYPLILYFSKGIPLFFLASVVGGLVWGMLGGGLINRLMERVPEDERPSYLAVHNLVLNIGILLGSLLGPLLAQWVDVRDMMLVTGILRSLAGMLFLIWG